MGACSGIGRVVLIILNLVFLLISLALIAAGVILRFVPGTIMSFIAAGADALISTAKSSGINMPTTLGFVPMFGDIGVALLVAGVVLFVLSFLACCGACCKWRPFLIVFVVIMIVLIVILAALGGLFLVKDSLLHEDIKESLVEEVDSDSFKNIMNILQVELKCCGIAGKSDYKTLPKSCCADLKDTSCVAATTAITGDKVHDVGCYEKLFDYIENNKTWAIVALVALVVLLLLEVIFAIIIVKDVGDSNKVSPI